MALQQLRDWLLAPYYTQAAKQKCDVEYDAEHSAEYNAEHYAGFNAERPQVHRRLLVISGDVEFVENTIDVLLADLPGQCRAEAFFIAMSLLIQATFWRWLAQLSMAAASLLPALLLISGHSNTMPLSFHTATKVMKVLI
jgi:hypothetical protein